MAKFISDIKVEQKQPIVPFFQLCLKFRQEGIHECFIWPFSENILQKWTHVCVTMDKFLIRVFIDNVKQSQEVIYDKPFELSPEMIIVLGQEQDSFGEDFESHEAFSGYISNFVWWGSKLEDDTIMKINPCQALPEGDIIDWDLSKWELNEVDVSKIPIESICQIDQMLGLFVLTDVEFKFAMTSCDVVKGDRKTSLDIDNVAKLNSEYITISKELALYNSKSCLVKEGLQRWLGMIANDNEEWVDYQSQTVYGSNVFGINAKKLECLVVWQNRVVSSNCETSATCNFCKVPHDKYLTLKGLPQHQIYQRGLFDRFYYPYGQMNSLPMFR